LGFRKDASGGQRAIALCDPFIVGICARFAVSRLGDGISGCFAGVWGNGIAENRAACHFEAMRLIETFASPDTKQKISLYQRDDGLFSFDEMHEDFDDLIGHYWALGPQSGLYADEASARADIQATTRWLRTD
jgi:hypothetical protein